MVRIAADFAVGVYEAVMYDLALDKFRHQAGILYQYRLESFGLGGFVREDLYLEAFLYVAAYVGSEEFEVFVERRLRGNMEKYLIVAFNSKGRIEKDCMESFHSDKGRGGGVYIEGIKPKSGPGG